MSLDFDGVDDLVTSTTSQIIGTQYSVGAWFNADSLGGINFGTICSQGRLNAERLMLLWAGTGSAQLQWTTRRTLSWGVWTMTTPFAALSGWKWVGATYDGSSPSNHPTLYTWVDPTFSVLTVGAGLTMTSTPDGDMLEDDHPFVIGNRLNGDITWDGKLAEVVCYQGILSEAAMRSVVVLGVNAEPDHFNYCPLDPTAQNLGASGTAFTITGAIAAENPPIRPAGRRG